MAEKEKLKRSLTACLRHLSPRLAYEVKRQQEALALLGASAAGCERHATFLPAEAERPDSSRKKHQLTIVPLLLALFPPLRQLSETKQTVLAAQPKRGPRSSSAVAGSPSQQLLQNVITDLLAFIYLQGPCGLGPKVAV